MRRTLALLAILLVGCEKKDEKPAENPLTPPKSDMPGKTKPEGEPDRISVQHILIGFKGSVPRKEIKRSQEEAKELVRELLARARRGESFEDLVTYFTDDSPPGTYRMVNYGVAAIGDEWNREGEKALVAGFGNVGFKLKVGEIGVAEYDPISSPYGWHIIKRLK